MWGGGACLEGLWLARSDIDQVGRVQTRRANADLLATVPLVRSDEELQRLCGEVAVIIPLYGKVPDDFPILIRGLRNQFAGEIIIGASATSEMPQIQGVTIVNAKQRLSPSSAKNRAAYHATKDYLLFLDADNLLGESSLGIMRDALETGDTVIAAAATYYQEDRSKISFFGASHRHWAGLTKFLSNVPQGTNLSSLGAHAPDRVEIEVAANAYMIRRSDFLSLGGFDEVTFPSHFEESDLSYRARQSTKRAIVCCLDARVYNDMPISVLKRLSAKDPIRSYYNARSRAVFTARHLGHRAWLIYVIAGQFAFGLVYVWSEIRARGSLKDRLSSIFAYAQGMLDGLLLSRHELKVRDPV